MMRRGSGFPATAAILAMAAAISCAATPRAPEAPAVVGSGESPLPFVEDDYSSALQRAREANLPLFVEVWAPW